MDETWHWHESISEVKNKDRFFPIDLSNWVVKWHFHEIIPYLEIETEKPFMSQVSKFQKFFCSLFYFMILLLSMQKIREKDKICKFWLFTRPITDT